MISKKVLINKKTGDKYQILCTREIFIDIYNIITGEIKTLDAEELRSNFDVVVS